MIRTPAMVACLAVYALLLAGCGRINTSLSHTLADNWPVWAGGMPKNVPPRPGDPRYARFFRELSRTHIEKKPTLILKKTQRKITAQ